VNGIAKIAGNCQTLKIENKLLVNADRTIAKIAEIAKECQIEGRFPNPPGLQKSN
jgi:hypothetical protein